jgi:hypothetical protein
MVDNGEATGGGDDPGRRDRLSTAAFGVGLVAAVTGVVYFVAVPLGLVGLVLGVFAIRRPGGVRRLALGGILLSTIGLLVGLGLVAFLVFDDDEGNGAISVIDGIESSSNDAEHPPQRDIDGQVECEIEVSVLRAAGRLTNHTTTVASYQLIAAWERDGQPIAQSTAIVESVPPGGTRTWEVTATGHDAPASTTCRVLRIDRSTG